MSGRASGCRLGGRGCKRSVGVVRQRSARTDGKGVWSFQLVPLQRPGGCVARIPPAAIRISSCVRLALYCRRLRCLRLTKKTVPASAETTRTVYARACQYERSSYRVVLDAPSTTMTTTSHVTPRRPAGRWSLPTSSSARGKNRAGDMAGGERRGAEVDCNSCGSLVAEGRYIL